MYRRYYSGYENDLLSDKADDFGAKKSMSLPSLSDTNSNDNEISIVDSGNGDICDLSEGDISVNSFNNKILGPLAIDDIILIGILLLLVHEQCDDTLMLVIVGFILLTGFII